MGPIVDGTERLGVLRLGLPDEADGDDPELRHRCSVVAGLAGHLVATKLAYGDALNVTRRSTPLTVAAELLWQLLPPLTFTSRDLVITAVLEPHDRLGGDGFDYAVDKEVATRTRICSADLGWFSRLSHRWFGMVAACRQLTAHMLRIRK